MAETRMLLEIGRKSFFQEFRLPSGCYDTRNDELRALPYYACAWTDSYSAHAGQLHCTDERVKPEKGIYYFNEGSSGQRRQRWPGKDNYDRPGIRC